jgi:ribonuclease BN (tRNA processing enzyme)
MKVTIIGAGESFSDPFTVWLRILPDIAGRTILVDCGRATTYKLAQPVGIGLEE